MPVKDQHEQKFFKALSDIFVGAKIEGDSGFINLMAIKSRYYQTGVFPLLKKDIDEALIAFPEFREELFDKLYTFFQRYFSESGSIYFRYTSLNQNVYEKVYTDDRDVILFWKTHMLYYVKTDRIFRSVNVEVEGTKFYFDASKISLKKANEKREVIYAFRKLQGEDGTLVFEVDYSERGRVTKVDEILKETRKAGHALNEDTLNQAFRIFEKQSEVDFFINKDARSFLQEQFDLWMYQYLFDGQNIWSAERIAQLQALKGIAYKVIAFISQFEDELVRVWNKPKFVLNSHYVLTLNKLIQSSVFEQLLNHPNFPQQVQEWQDLGMLEKNFRAEMLAEKDLTGEMIHNQYKFLPFDTKHFPDVELEILSLFDNLDEQLDGWLIHSENYQALNSILMKFKGEIQTIYIDPPFNTGDDFDYVDNYQDSTWLTILNNRIKVASETLKRTGNHFMHLDWNANYYGRILVNNQFGKENFRNEIIWAYRRWTAQSKKFQNSHDYILWSTKTDLYYWNQLFDEYADGGSHYTAEDEIGKFRWQYLNGQKYKLYQSEGTRMKDWWEDIPYINSMAHERTGFDTQKPELLLARIIKTSSQQNDIILDYFLGSGTTIATAHKIGRRWVGVEMGSQFENVVLPRMKRVLFGESSGISKNSNWQGGGFFKYFDLEQYEDVLKRAKYEDSTLFENPSADPYHSYVFMRDLKMLDSIEIDLEENQVHFHPERLYPDPGKPHGTSIDLAETLSQRTGKWIKRITSDYVEFQDGERMSLTDPDWQTIKPLVWWQ